SDLSADDIGRRVEALGARHVAIDGAGHYVHCERPDATIAAISAFLDEVGP
ncbi:MAG: alpha/beta hydrolase, partial [Acidimicrobiia bacterium]|nr:alpha/beta hydrolase [Acidimicrobiia bacterium]